MDDHDLSAIWAGDPAPSSKPPSPAELAARASKLRRTVVFRNARELAASALVAVVFGHMAIVAEGAPLMRLACALVIAAVLFVAAKLWAHGRNLPAPAPDAPTAEHLAHHRASLERQRDLLAGVPRWYLAPFAPGMICFLVSTLVETPLSRAPLGLKAAVAAAFVAVVGGVFAAIAALNRVAARKLSGELDALS